jgi:hypothetical protein
MREKVNFLNMLHLSHCSEGSFTLLAPYLIANMKNKRIADVDCNATYAGGIEE